MSNHPSKELVIGEFVEGIVDGNIPLRVLRVTRIASPFPPHLQPSRRPLHCQLAIGARLLLKPLQQVKGEHGLVEHVRGMEAIKVFKPERLLVGFLFNFKFSTPPNLQEPFLFNSLAANQPQSNFRYNQCYKSFSFLTPLIIPETLSFVYYYK